MPSKSYYHASRLQWRPIGYYWPPDVTEGPEVLLAWKQMDEWHYGFGRGYVIDDVRSFWVQGSQVTPVCFAYITPPDRKTL